MIVDVVKVLYYKMLGSTAKPDSDTLLGTDKSVDTGNHSITLSLSPGTYKVYTVAVDRAGNKSKPSQPVTFEMKSESLPPPKFL